MKFCIQPADVYKRNDYMAMMLKKFKMEGVNLAELISTRIKSLDMDIFLSDLFED